MRVLTWSLAVHVALIAMPARAQETRTAVSMPSYEGVSLVEWTRQLDDRIPSVRIHAAYVIAELGPSAASSVPVIS